MLINVPEKYLPILLQSGAEMGRLFSRAVAGSMDCLMIARFIIERHPEDLEEYLADFLFGVKSQENRHD